MGSAAGLDRGENTKAESSTSWSCPTRALSAMFYPLIEGQVHKSGLPTRLEINDQERWAIATLTFILVSDRASIALWFVAEVGMPR